MKRSGERVILNLSFFVVWVVNCNNIMQLLIDRLVTSLKVVTVKYADVFCFVDLLTSPLSSLSLKISEYFVEML